MLHQPTPAAYLKGLPKRPLRVLVACEFSGRVRDAFIARGHDAISCDLLDTDAPGPHIMGDLIHLLRQPWDLIIGFPPCTYLCASALWRCLPQHDPEGERWHAREDSLRFVRAILNANSPRISLENPTGCISTRLYWDEEFGDFEIRSYADALAAKGKHKTSLPASQIVHPHEYGHPESKTTNLWLKNLPLLEPTNILKIEEHGKWHPPANGKPGVWRWLNQTVSGQSALGENAQGTRWKIRSLTYQGIADAMAARWSPDLTLN
jgi:hypothetical protein